MKKTLQTVLIFAVTMAVMLGLAAVIERAVGARPAAEEAEEPVETAVYNEINEDGAAVITLLGDTASVSGLGAQVEGNVVTIRYPGTYRVEGTLEDGQLTVDLGDFSGAAYIILNGASITNSAGPALYAAQADLTAIRLADGTSNSLADGEGYVLTIKGEEHAGAALYSADDLLIDGGGTLTVTGNSADGIRAKDALTIESGSLNITGADDGIQVNDELVISGGKLLIGAGDDGISVTRGGMTMSGGQLWINSTGDAVSAAQAIEISGGTINATACGGSLLYSYIALNDISAKGLKAETIAITGGTIDLDTADDALHASQDITITGGSFTLASGDDALHADGVLDIRNVAVDITECYEGLEASAVRIGNIWIRAYAQSNGVDAGEDGFAMDDGILILSGPRAIGSESFITISGGTVTLTTDGTKSPISFVTADVAGGMRLYCSSGGADTLLSGGEVPASLAFILPADVPSGTEVTLWNAAGGAVYTITTTEYGGAFLFAGDPLVIGQSYTLTAGDYSYTAVLTDGCTVSGDLSSAAQGSASGEASSGMTTQTQAQASGEPQEQTQTQASGEPQEQTQTQASGEAQEQTQSQPFAMPMPGGAS